MSDAARYFSPEAFAELAAAEAGHWWFRARNRLLLWLLRTRIGNIHSFLEVGCGTGFVLEGIRGAYPTATLSGSEYFEEGLMHARMRIPSATLRRLDAVTMDDADAFDVIGSFDVIEHIEQDEVVLANLVRALRRGGTLVLTVPQHRWLWSATDDYARHVRRYSRRELLEKTRRAGLETIYVSSFVTLLLPLMWLSRKRAQLASDPMAEFRIPRWLNATLAAVMHVEFALMRAGLRFPAGGSLVYLGRKS